MQSTRLGLISTHLTHPNSAAPLWTLRIPSFIRVSTGKICGYEALARWNDPLMGFLPPSSFIGTLEENRLIHKVDCFVIRQVCEDLRTLQEAGEALVPVSINLSSLDFELCDIFTVTERFRDAYGVEPGLLNIEVTEETLNEGSRALVDALKQFHRAGYHVCVDDFGSGYAALNNLLDHDFEVLKLGLEFLRTYDENPRTGMLIKNVVQIARDVNVAPLQQGVERQDHYNFLRSLPLRRRHGPHGYGVASAAGRCRRVAPPDHLRLRLLLWHRGGD